MNNSVSLIGYGEAGRTFARAADWGMKAQVFDLAPLDDIYAGDGVQGCTSLRAALAGSSQVISMVTADQALVAAQSAAKYLSPGSLYFDMNSVAPQTKCKAAAIIEKAGARYVDVAIMAPVSPARIAVPLLVSGPHCEDGIEALVALGFNNARIVGDDVGRASTIKMLRSVMYKGVEALTAECLIACEKAGVTDEVLGSFNNDWSEQADYRLDRMLVHGTRRAAEMEEAVATLEGLGVQPLLTVGTAERQARLGKFKMDSPPVGLKAKLERISK